MNIYLAMPLPEQLPLAVFRASCSSSAQAATVTTLRTLGNGIQRPRSKQAGQAEGTQKKEGFLPFPNWAGQSVL